MARHPGGHPIGQLFRRRRPVGNDRDLAERGDDFGHDALVERASRDREPGGGGGMRVHDRRNVAPESIDLQVHAELA